MRNIYKRLPLTFCLLASQSHSLSLSQSLAQSQTLPSSPSPSSSSSTTTTTTTTTLDFDVDRFDGVIIKSLPCCKTEFSSRLSQSLKEFRKDNKKAVWLKIPVDKMEYSSIAVSKGFQLHSCEKEYLMLTKWLPNTTSTIPNQPHNQIGIGCVCYDKKKKRLLVVKERWGYSHSFKIPTGIIDPKEDLSTAAVRELQEETGIIGKFEGIIGFRHAHEFLNDKSDLFFLCIVEPLTFDITIQEEELIACEWLDLDNYFNQEWFKGKPLNKMMNEEIKKAIEAIDNNKLKGTMFKEHSLQNGWRNGNSMFYSL